MTSSIVLFRRLMAKARLRHFQAMVTVAKLGSIKGAAEQMGLTQPAVTQLIAELERLTDCQLFYRHDRGTRPTELGLRLLPHIRDALAVLQDGVDQFVLGLDSAMKTVRVGAIEGAINGLLERALPTFARQYPHISVSVQEATAEHIGALMANRHADLLLARKPDVMPQEWMFSSLMQDELVAVCGPQHPLAARVGLTMQELSNESWMLLPPSTEARQRLEAEILDRAAHSSAYRQLQTRSFAILQSMLQAERLMLLAPLSIIRPRLNGEQLIRLDLAESFPLAPIGALMPVDAASESAAQVLKRFLADFASSRP